MGPRWPVSRLGPRSCGVTISVPQLREEVKSVTPEEPLVLTVEEAARILRIGRSAAYEQARRFIATGGAEGLPALRLGRRLRVPREALNRMLAIGGEAGDADG